MQKIAAYIERQDDTLAIKVIPIDKVSLSISLYSIFSFL